MRIDLVLLTYICVVLCRSFGVAGKYIQLDLNVALKDVSSESLSESSQQALFESFNEITNVPIEDMELANVRVKAENKKNHLWDLDVDIRFTITENTFPQYKENSDRENRIRKDIDNAFRQSLLPAPSGKPEDIQLNQVLHKNSIIFARHLIFVQVKSLKIRNSMRLKTLDLASQLFQKKSSVPLNIPPPPENPSSQPSSQPSTQPTGAPTQEFQTRKPSISSFTGTPTESPSESPTESPTENPFGSPTESPTETPTDSPTEVPSFAPTFSFPFNPTETPSESPTESPTDERDQPSSQPSSQPTSAPTLSIALGTYKFSVFLQIDNVTSTSINSADEAVLLQAISDATDVPVKQLEFQTVVDSAQRRRLSVSTSHSLVIEVKFYIYTQDYPELNGDTNKIFLYLSNLLNLSVNEGSLTILLRKESLKFFNQKLLWSRIIKVAYTTFNVPTTPTIMPSPAPTSVPTILPSGSPTTTSSPSISSAPTTTTSPTTTSSPSSSSAPTATTSPTTSMSPTITLSPTIHTPAPSNGGGGGSTLSPTRIPTVFPTRSPSSIGGGGASGVPTISPTSSPTQQVKAIIQYKTWIYLDGCSNSTLRNDSLLAIETALAHVYNISLTHIAYSRSTSGKSINNGYEIAVAYKLTFNLIDYPAYTNATLFYWAQKTILLESWRNGLLKTEILLHSPTTDAYNQLNPTNITNIEFTELSVKDPSNIQSITPNSDDYPTTIKVAILIGIIAGSILGFGLLLLCCYVGYSQYMKAEKAKENSLRIPIQRMPSHDIPLDDIYNWDSHEKSDAIMIDVMDEFDYQISPRNSIMRNHVIDDYDDQMSPRNSMMRGQVLELSFMSHTAESRM